MNDSVNGYLANDVLDVPIDGPVIYLTRDIVDGTKLPVIDVWIERPRRCVDTGPNPSITWRGQTAADEGALGTFTEAAVRHRFNMVPDADECIVLDNPKVN